MKKNWNGHLLHGLEELSLEEKSKIIGGESLWYWVGYAIGAFSYSVAHASGEQTGGQKLMNAALG
jgi:hypothetical protein